MKSLYLILLLCFAAFVECGKFNRLAHYNKLQKYEAVCNLAKTIKEPPGQSPIMRFVKYNYAICKAHYKKGELADSLGLKEAISKLSLCHELLCTDKKFPVYNLYILQYWCGISCDSLTIFKDTLKARLVKIPHGGSRPSPQAFDPNNIIIDNPPEPVCSDNLGIFSLKILIFLNGNIPVDSLIFSCSPDNETRFTITKGGGFTINQILPGDSPAAEYLLIKDNQNTYGLNNFCFNVSVMDSKKHILIRKKLSILLKNEY